MCEILRQTDPHCFVSASYELAREYREYERTSTVVANAYVGPIVSSYLGDLEQRLQQDGFRGDLMMRPPPPTRDGLGEDLHPPAGWPPGLRRGYAASPRVA